MLVVSFLRHQFRFRTHFNRGPLNLFFAGIALRSFLTQVGFFLRQFKRTGDVPPALKTAILWQPKSWASIRKVLLAPPGERIAMPG